MRCRVACARKLALREHGARRQGVRRGFQVERFQILDLLCRLHRQRLGVQRQILVERQRGCLSRGHGKELGRTQRFPNFEGFLLCFPRLR